MALSYVILGKSSSFYLVMSMIPICFGVMLTVSGDLDLTFVGYTPRRAIYHTIPVHRPSRTQARVS
jgi:hypothetical protein